MNLSIIIILIYSGGLWFLHPGGSETRFRPPPPSAMLRGWMQPGGCRLPPARPLPPPPPRPGRSGARLPAAPGRQQRPGPPRSRAGGPRAGWGGGAAPERQRLLWRQKRRRGGGGIIFFTALRGKPARARLREPGDGACGGCAGTRVAGAAGHPKKRSLGGGRVCRGARWPCLPGASPPKAQAGRGSFSDRR